LPNASAKTVARATVKQMSSFSNLNAVGTLYGAGTSNNPKRASLVFNASTRTAIRLCGVQHGFREDGLFLLHCGWGQLQECYMRAIGTLMLSLLVCCLFAVSPVRAQIGIGISIDVAPPPLPVYDQPPIPAPGYIWTPGYWAWDDDTGYYWVPGTWVLPPEPALLWTPGYWGWNDGVYAFHEGYWGPEVGFYGGVSYGFGYTGAGYEGGYWRDGAFFYNRNVNNISNVQITNVYNKTVIVNNTTNVSYNGGTGGTTAQATPQQVAAASQPHVAPTAVQTQHVQAAAKDPALSLNSNQGHPTVAATAHASQLSGVGVVAAHPGTPVAAIAPQGHHVGGSTGGAGTGNAPAGQGTKVGPGNAATLPGNHTLPGTQSPGTAGTKSGPGNTATLPGNHALPSVQSPGTAGTGATGTGAAGTKTGPGNAATQPGNHPLPGVQSHGGTATGSPPTTVGSTNPTPDVKMHKGTGSGGPPPGPAPQMNKLPSTAVHTPAVHTPPPPPPQPHISSPPAPHIQAVKPPPPPPARVASPPPPRPAPPPPRPAPKPAPAAAKKCPPGQQHC
jgi:WXXGXW repeat (2 copies)